MIVVDPEVNIENSKILYVGQGLLKIFKRILKHNSTLYVGQGQLKTFKQIINNTKIV